VVKGERKGHCLAGSKSDAIDFYDSDKSKAISIARGKSNEQR